MRGAYIRSLLWCDASWTYCIHEVSRVVLLENLRQPPHHGLEKTKSGGIYAAWQ